MNALREAWQECITAADYDAHMADVGQAQANAWIVRSFIDRWLNRPARVLVAGAGTGQLFDYAGDRVFDGLDVVFTDISPGLLDCLRARVATCHFKSVAIQLDDLEDTRIDGSMDAAIVVLVFEHIDWRKGVRSLARIAPRRCLVVIQRNPPQPIARPLAGTLAVLDRAAPTLVEPEDLQRVLAAHGYAVLERDDVEVPDGKTMIALVFGRG